MYLKQRPFRVGKLTQLSTFWIFLLFLVSCNGQTDQSYNAETETGLVEKKVHPLVLAAKAQIGVTTFYDPAYVSLDYPGGDVAQSSGVCTDVLIRAFRDVGEVGIDLQKEVHEDMKAHFELYPENWGLTKPDPNIDHRRVPNLMTWFKRFNYTASGETAADFFPGDIVAWDLGNGLLHVGIVSDNKTPKHIPLIIHNIGSGVVEENVLFRFDIIGHYRGTFSI